MSCSKEAKEALIGSIEKWQLIIEGKKIDLGAKNCPLCKLFYPFDEADTGLCLRCPIFKKVGKSYCADTPYADWKRHHDENHYLFSCFGHCFAGLRVWCEKCREIAQKELDFLKNLLKEIEPKEEK
jgi:hypothetical protein